jgi:hypothetical protein
MRKIARAETASARQSMFGFRPIPTALPKDAPPISPARTARRTAT